MHEVEREALRPLGRGRDARAPRIRHAAPLAASRLVLEDFARSIVDEADEHELPPAALSADTGALRDLLAPGLKAVFCGINPGRVSAAAGFHFANPRNDFWRLLHDGGFTTRLLDPSEQEELLTFGYGVTNAAYRTTPGSGDLRRADFEQSAARLERVARELEPAWIGFVGKEAYRGAFGERAQLGLQQRRLGETQLFVLPSTSPANAAVPYEERLRWFREFRRLVRPELRIRDAARALVLDNDDRILLVQFRVEGARFWAAPGGGVEAGESDEAALQRELIEECGLRDAPVGPIVWLREHVWSDSVNFDGQRERYRVVRVPSFDPAPKLSPQQLEREYVFDVRWWTLDEIRASGEEFVPRGFTTLLERLLRDGLPAEPLEVGV